MASIVRNFIAGLSPRERRMVAIMGVAMTVFICFLTAFLVNGSIKDLEEDTKEWNALYVLVKQQESNYKQMQNAGSSKQAMGKPKPLRTLVDNVVEKVGITQPDTKELSNKNHAGGWLERSADVSFRSIDLKGMVEFLEHLERNRRQFPIAVTKLDVRKQRREEGMYRVEMTVSTFEKSDVMLDKNGKPIKNKEGRK